MRKLDHWQSTTTVCAREERRGWVRQLLLESRKGRTSVQTNQGHNRRLQRNNTLLRYAANVPHTHTNTQLRLSPPTQRANTKRISWARKSDSFKQMMLRQVCVCARVGECEHREHLADRKEKAFTSVVQSFKPAHERVFCSCKTRRKTSWSNNTEKKRVRSRENNWIYVHKTLATPARICAFQQTWWKQVKQRLLKYESGGSLADLPQRENQIKDKEENQEELPR